MQTPDFSLSFSSTFSELNQSTPKKSREQNNNTSYNSRTSTQSNLEYLRQRLHTQVSQCDSEDEFETNSSHASQASVRKKKRNLKRSLTSNSNTSVSSFETQSFTSSIIRTGKTMQRILEGDDSEDDFEDPKKSSKKSDNNQSSGKRRRKESVCNRRFETGNKSGSKNTPSTKRSFQHQSLPKARAQGKVIARTQPQAPAPPLPESANSIKKRIFLNPFFTQPSTCGQNIQDAIKRNETCLSLSKQQKSKVTTPPQGVSEFPYGPQDNRCDDSLDLCQIPSYSGNKSQSKRINSGEIEDGPVINNRIFEKLVGSLRPKDIRFKSNAIKALQEGSEAHIVGLMEDAFLAALHAKRVTVTSEDLKLVLKIRNGGRQSLT